MKTRWSILLVALLGVSCTTQNKNSALVVSKLVLGTATTDPGPPPVTSCAYDPGSVEFSFAQINPAALAYYRCERILEDIGPNAESIFNFDAGDNNRARTLQGLKNFFLPFGVVAMARNARRALPDYLQT